MLIGKEELQPLRGAEAVLASVLRWLLRWTLRLLCSPRMPIALQRFGGRQVARFSRFPGGAFVRRDTVGGVPGEWVRTRSATAHAGEPTILYLHGGAFCVGSRLTHRLSEHHGLRTPGWHGGPALP